MRYAKITETGALEYAPQNKDGVVNWLSTPEKARKEGYYPVETIEVKAGYKLTGYKVENFIIKGVYEQVLPEPVSYAEKRAKAYPSIADQLDMIYWDKIYDTNVWFETISAVKAKYPKE